MINQFKVNTQDFQNGNNNLWCSEMLSKQVNPLLMTIYLITAIKPLIIKRVVKIMNRIQYIIKHLHYNNNHIRILPLFNVHAAKEDLMRMQQQDISQYAPTKLKRLQWKKEAKPKDRIAWSNLNRAHIN